ncbi:MAG: hypothetical protein IPL95_11335 [Saprospiraceae bacterium]|nr:hypothetical protein [Saprospiraceae bacterium]
MAKKPIAKATKIEEKKETVNTIESSKSNSTLLYTILTAALLILMFVIRLNFLEIPYERDEGAYSYYGQLLNEGKTPYIDFYEQKASRIVCKLCHNGMVFRHFSKRITCWVFYHEFLYQLLYLLLA